MEVTFNENNIFFFLHRADLSVVNPTQEMIVEYKFDDGTALPENLAIGTTWGHNQNIYFEVEQSAFTGIVVQTSDIDKYSIQTLTSSYLIAVLNSVRNLTLLTSPGPTNYVFGNPSVTSGSLTAALFPIFIRSSEGILPENNFLAPIIRGHKEDENFKSKYTIIQEVGSITNGDFKLAVKYNKDYHSDLLVTAIYDAQGNDIIGNANIEQGDGQTRIHLSKEKIADLRAQRISFEIEATIDKDYYNLSSYLNEDYLELPIEASTNFIPSSVSDVASTWARPSGEAVSQTINQGETTNDLSASDFVDNLNSGLLNDEPFVVGFLEEQEFNELGDDFLNVVIESSISSIQNTIRVPVVVVENIGTVFVHHVNQEGKRLVESEQITGIIGEAYSTHPKEIEHFNLREIPTNAEGVYSKEEINVTYIYDIVTVPPVDPLNPENEVNPENKPELPENQGLLSIDFVSIFNFGSQAISAQEEMYYAQPQRLLNEDGTINEDEERPNYVQISDRRSENDRNGWQLAVTQNGQFETRDEEQLLGARLSLTNQALSTGQGGSLPELQQTNPLILVPDVKRVLVMAQGEEGAGTWIYRFGDQETAGKSIALMVPQGTNPKAERYKTSLIGELSAVPWNE